jgi:hypothetical protein
MDTESIPQSHWVVLLEFFLHFWSARSLDPHGFRGYIYAGGFFSQEKDKEKDKEKAGLCPVAL